MSENTELEQLVFALGRYGSLVGSVLAFYSDNPSSNPAEVYKVLCVQKLKINKNREGVVH